MKLEIKSCKSWQLHTGAPLPALTLPCSKEQISQCQRKKKLVNGQKPESVNIVNKQTPLSCSEHFRHRALWGQGRETIAVSPPKGSRCLKVLVVVVMASTLCLSCLSTSQMASLMNQNKSLVLLQALKDWIRVNITYVIILSFPHRGTWSSTLSSMAAGTTQLSSFSAGI